jgi:hypothetical protein
MKVRTSNLEGAALDWAVAQCKGISLLNHRDNKWELCWVLLGDDSGDYYSPSTDWSQAGPIIEKAELELFRDKESCVWISAIDSPENDKTLFCEEGATPLIAAMRCFVASQLGDEVEIPEGL